jgi:hypothetical protein
MRPWPAVALLALLLLAGCSGKPSSPAPSGDPVGVITDPRDTAYLSNQSMAAGSHIHDYWHGRDRVPVVESDGFYGSSTCNGGGCADGMTFDGVRPDEGSIVPQGTKWVNGTFTLTKSGDNQFTRLELWVKTARDQDSVKWGDVQSGVPFSIDATQETDDPPHYVLSLWRFEVKAYNSADTVRVEGHSHWSVEAVRGLPLVAYPPHPDRWNGATRLDLLSESRSTQLVYQTEDPAGGGTSTSCYGGCLGTHALPSGAVVPFDTDHVTVRLKVDQGLPAGIGLWFHGSDTWAPSKPAGTMGAPGELVYTIPIEGAMADSPYAPQSLWEFRVWLDEPEPAAQAWTGTYTLSVTAFHDADGS